MVNMCHEITCVDFLKCSFLAHMRHESTCVDFLNCLFLARAVTLHLYNTVHDHNTVCPTLHCAVALHLYSTVHDHNTVFFFAITLRVQFGCKSRCSSPTPPPPAQLQLGVGAKCWVQQKLSNEIHTERD